MKIEEAKKNLKGIDIRNFLSGMSEQSDYIVDRAEETNEAIQVVLSELEKSIPISVIENKINEIELKIKDLAIKYVEEQCSIGETRILEHQVELTRQATMLRFLLNRKEN